MKSTNKYGSQRCAACLPKTYSPQKYGNNQQNMGTCKAENPSKEFLKNVLNWTESCKL